MRHGRSSWPCHRVALPLAALACLPVAAAAATTAGHGALALAAITGQYDPALGSHSKLGLLRLLSDRAFGGSATQIIVKADVVTCRAGNVNLKAFGCTLTFGTHTVTLNGRKAAELYATLIEAGVPSDGAAGTSFESVKSLSCTLALTELGGPGTGDGGGASCSYQPGP